GALSLFARRLQAVAQVGEQLADLLPSHLVPHRPKFRRKLPNTFAGPSQRRHRIATCHWFDQRLEVPQQRRILLGQLLKPPSRTTHSLVLRQFTPRMPSQLAKVFECPLGSAYPKFPSRRSPPPY